MLRRLCGLLQEALFPRYCVGCHTEGSWWCETCRRAVSHVAVCACPTCGVRTETGEPCSINCQNSTALDRAVAFFDYASVPAVAELIKILKYNFAQDSLSVWPSVIAEFKLDVPISTIIIPVPLYPRRERWRGFNQAELFAQMLAGQINVPMSKGELVRIRFTHQQATLSKQKRLENVARAFEWRGKTAAPEHVVLVDDVYTTGSTLNECARVLKQAGSRYVMGLTIARD